MFAWTMSWLLGIVPASARGAPRRALGQGASARRTVDNTEGILRDLRRRNSGKIGVRDSGLWGAAHLMS